MEPSQKLEFRTKLTKMLSDIEEVRELGADSQAVVELDQQAIGRLSRMDAMQQQAMAKATEGNRLREIKAINAALKRLDEDDFGYCMECGEDIAIKRLALNPTAFTCIECAQGG